MLFCCEACLYIFEGKEDCRQCPDCGREAVRRANEKEQEEYKRNQEELKKE